MRGRGQKQTSMFVTNPEERIPSSHPIRKVKELADEVLRALGPRFDEMYAEAGRPSIPPERLLKATLLMALYSVRSERMLCDRLNCDLLFRWFLDMNFDESVFDPTVFTKNRQRLLNHEVGKAFLGEVVRLAKRKRLTSAEHFSVDGTLIEAWASLKSFRPKDEDRNDRGDGNGWGDFRGGERSNKTHESKTDPESKLMRKGKGREAKLSFMAHLVIENRNGLIVNACATPATGTAEREAALAMLDEMGGRRRITIAADRGYDTQGFVADCRDRDVTPHVAQNVSGRRSAIDGRTVRSDGYRISQVVRRRIESCFGWLKKVAGMARTRFRGVARTELALQMAASALTLLRVAKLMTAA